MARIRGGGVGRGGGRGRGLRTRRRRGVSLEDIPKVDIYLLVDDDWYSIKTADCHKYESSKIHLQPVIPQLPQEIHRPAFAVVGSIIYATGGFDLSEENAQDEDDEESPRGSHSSPTSKVFYIDTIHPQRGWIAAPPMNAARYQHKMVADAGKMYVFGCLKLKHPDSPDGKCIFAEVYDPLNSSAGWKELARVSDDEIKLTQAIRGHGVVGEHGADLDNRMILFHPCSYKVLCHAYNYKGLYYLDTDRQQYGVYDDKFDKSCHSSTFLDGVFYFMYYDRMYAYDVSTSSGECHRVDLRDVQINTLPYPEKSGGPTPTTRLQSLDNGHLALVWLADISTGQFDDVHCSIIKMSKEGDLFVGHVLVCSSYSVNSGWLEDCMVVCSSEADVSLDAEPAKIPKRANEDVSLDAERAKITKRVTSVG